MKTIKQKLAEFDGIDRENTVLTCALSDFVKGKAHKIGTTADQFTLYISRPESGCGGIAIVNDGGTVRAYYFEEAYRQQMERFSLCLTGEDTELNRGLMLRRSRWEEARKFIISASR